MAIGFLPEGLRPQFDELGNVNCFFDVVGDGAGREDGRDREYFDELDLEDDGDWTGIRGLPIALGGVPEVDGSIDGFDLLYFEAADEGDPLPE